MIEALLQAQYRLPSDFDTIISIVRMSDDEAIITSVFAIWRVKRVMHKDQGFEVHQLARR